MLKLPIHANAGSADQGWVEPAEFERSVRDALSHLYDTVYLQAHPLARVVRRSEPRLPLSLLGKTLHKSLLDSIETVRPAAGTSSASKAMLRYRIMELRYVEGLDAGSVQQELAISKSEYYREHGRALDAVLSKLWDRWGLGERMTTAAPDVEGAPSLVQQEADSLSSSHRVERLDLHRLVGEVLAMLTPLAERRGVELRAQIPAAISPCWGERVVVRQALLGVAHRAVDVAAPGEVHVRAEAAPAPARLVVTASRSAGDPATWPARDDATTRELVESIGGSLEVSAIRGGVAAALVFPSHGKTLLVVDNNTDFVALMSRYLDHHGWTVVDGRGIDEVGRLVARYSPDAIMLDVLMPEQDGWDILRALRDLPDTQRIPVVICSVLHEPQLALDLGASAYLAKPVSQPDLIRLLAHLCSDRPAEAGAPQVGRRARPSALEAPSPRER